MINQKNTILVRSNDSDVIMMFIQVFRSNVTNDQDLIYILVAEVVGRLLFRLVLAELLVEVPTELECVDDGITVLFSWDCEADRSGNVMRAWVSQLLVGGFKWASSGSSPAAIAISYDGGGSGNKPDIFFLQDKKILLFSYGVHQ